MANTISTYNHTAQKLLELSMADEATNFYVELLEYGLFDATHTTKDEVDDFGSGETSGNGWTLGGENLTNVLVSIVDTNKSMLDADNVIVTATGGSIGPASHALIYVNEGNAGLDYSPLWFVTFDEERVALVGEDFNFAFSFSGLARITVV